MVEDCNTILASILTSDFVYVTEGIKVAVPIEHIVIKCTKMCIAGSSVITTLVGQAEVAICVLQLR